MRRNFSRCTFIAKTATLAVLLWLLSPVLYAQSVDILPADDCMVCTGQLSYTHPTAVTILWYDATGTLVQGDVSTTSTVTGLCPGLYMLEVTDGTTVDQQWLSVNTASVSAGLSAEVFQCAGGDPIDLTSLLVGADAGGYWTDLSNVTLPATELSAAPSSNGAYLYHVNAPDCEVVARIDLVVNLNADPGLTTTYLICESYDPFVLTQFLSGTPDEGGVWMDNTATPMSGTYDPAVDETGLFTYMIDTVAGCPPVFSTLYVVENPESDPGLPTEVLVCDGGPVFDLFTQIDGTPQDGGSWEDADGDDLTGLFDPAVQPAGTYTYTVAGLSPCPAASVDIEVLYMPALDAGEDGQIVLCETAPTVALLDQLGGSPMTGGTWTGPAALAGDDFDPAVHPAGTYTYTVEGVGCATQSAEVVVGIDGLPSAGTMDVLEVCALDLPLALNPLLDPTADVTGMWAGTGVEGTELLSIPPGQVTLTYTVEGGECPDASSALEVSIGAMPDAGADVELFFCEPGISVDLNAYVSPDGGFAAAWEDALGNPITPEVNVEAGETTYTLVVEGGICPPDVAVVAVEVDLPAFASLTESTILCETQFPVTLDGLPATDVSPLGVWTDASGDLLTDLTLTEPVGGTWIYTASNHPDCPPSVLWFEVEVSVQFDAETPQYVDVCHDAAAFDLDALVGVSSGLGDWSFNGEEVDPTVDPATAPSGSYVLDVPPAGPCPAASVEVVITVDPGMPFTAGEDLSICANSLDGLQIGQEPEAGCTYLWSPPELVSDPVTSNPFVVLDATSSTPELWHFSVVATNGICSVYDTVAVELLPTPEVTASADVGVCTGTDVNLSASGALEYTWFDATGMALSIGPSLGWTALYDTELTVSGSNAYGCMDEDEVLITAYPLPAVMVEAELSVGCGPQTWWPELTLANTSALQWTVNGTDMEDPAASGWTFAEPGTYSATLTCTSAEGCTYTQDLGVISTVYGYPDASFSFSPSAIGMDSPYLELIETGDDAVNWDWTLDGQWTAGDPEWMWEYSGGNAQHLEVCLEVANQAGCTDTLCRDIPIENTHWVYVPNAFTPDGDGVNEVFGPQVFGIDPDHYRMVVTNRWGEVIFETQNPAENWTGNVKGGDHFAQDGTYVWSLEIRDAYTAEQRRYTGHVTLIR